MNNQDNTLQFMQIAMKYLPEAQEQLEQAGIELSMELIQPFMTLLQKSCKTPMSLGKRMLLRKA